MTCHVTEVNTSFTKQHGGVKMSSLLTTTYRPTGGYTSWYLLKRFYNV